MTNGNTTQTDTHVTFYIRIRSLYYKDLSFKSYWQYASFGVYSSILLSFLDCLITRVTLVSLFTYARVWAAARRLLTISGGAGGGAGYGQPVRGAHRVTDLNHQRRDRGLTANQRVGHTHHHSRVPAGW